jgi:hypothetical protein
MVDIYLVPKPLALSTLPSHTAMTALHNTLESINNTNLRNPTITIPPTHLTDTYSPPEEILLGTGKTLYTQTVPKREAPPP